MTELQKLVDKSKKGDISSFMQLLSEKDALIYNIAFSYAKNSYDAEDYISEASIKAFDKIKHLKNDERDIVVLRYLKDYSLLEIAAIMNIPLSTVKTQLYRSLIFLSKDGGIKNEC
ncbi:hypothetical protein IAI10_09250 [Clostridium sp. 19966]|uniref:RNA polymerase sigma factor n=1 Tax=Clostridium sp. 19966 TaxID=2768166 RepID=UPI0028DE3C4E|nr:sigma factor-like helix-turn-helix DNA-binding protein [Clostridium sp. 19966]MDT8716844.1 hypothetical protein [Clostridium sp. 19966]